MSNKLFKILLVVLIIVIALFTIMVAVISTFDANKYKDRIEQIFHYQTGQTLILNGPIKIKVFPFPRAYLEDVAMRYRMKNKYFVATAEKFSFRVDWSFLFSDNINIHAINAQKMAIQYVESEHNQRTFKIDEFKGQLASSCCDITLPDFNLKSGSQVLKGDLKITLFPGTPKLRGNVSLSEWSLMKEPISKNQQLNAGPILSWLNGIEGKIEINIKKLNLAHLKLNNITLALSLKDNKLIIAPKGKMAGSDINGQITLGSLKEIPKLEADLNLQEADPAVLQSLLGAGSFPSGKVDVYYQGHSEGKDLSTLLSQLKSKLKIQINALKMPQYQANVSGELQIELNDVYHVTGKLSSPDWIVPIIAHDQQSKSEKILSNTPWRFEKLSGFMGKVDLEVNRLHFENLEIDKAKIQLGLNGKSFDVVSQGEIVSGKYAANLVVTPNDKGDAKIQGNISIRDANASTFLKQFSPKLIIQNGRVNLEFTGNGTGSNLSQVMGTLSGKGLITMNNVAIPSVQIDSRYVDFFSAMIKSLIPKSRKDTNLECFVMKFNVDNGVLNSKEKIGMQTRDLYALGGGELDFKTEKMNFELDLYPRSQLNIEIGSYNNIIRIKGSLSHPEVVTSVGGLVKEGGSLVLGVATGGLSLLAEKVYKLTTQRKSPCQQVLLPPN